MNRKIYFYKRRTVFCAIFFVGAMIAIDLMPAWARVIQPTEQRRHYHSVLRFGVPRSEVVQILGEPKDSGINASGEKLETWSVVYGAKVTEPGMTTMDSMFNTVSFGLWSYVVEPFKMYNSGDITEVYHITFDANDRVKSVVID